MRNRGVVEEALGTQISCEGKRLPALYIHCSRLTSLLGEMLFTREGANLMYVLLKGSE